ncbi:MAG: radical SAM protein [bacterium]
MENDVRKNPGLLKLELYCKGMRLDTSCDLQNDAAPILRIRGGLGSGLELILPHRLYTNVPVVEKFAKVSPYILKKMDGKYYIYNNEEIIAPVQLLKEPKFYKEKTTSGKLMERIGVMQGTYLGIYPTEVCHFWKIGKNCKFCSVGLNLGDTEEVEKCVSDVVETVKAARKELGITFVHFNTGYMEGKEIDSLMPYITTVKKKTGLLIGVQTPPTPDLKIYDHLKKIGVDHLSFCIELYNTERFKEVCPGKSEYLGQQRYLDAIEYTSRLFGKGKVSGEIIAGLEPPEDSIKAIEHFGRVGAFATVCIFRPTIGTALENYPPPKTDDMIPVFRRMYEVCLENNIPIGIAPKIRVSLVILPFEGIYFLEDKKKWLGKLALMNIMKGLYRTYFYTKLAFQRR